MIQLSQTEINASYAGESIGISYVATPRDGTTVTGECDCDWVDVSTTDDSIDVDIAENTGTTSRSIVLSVSYENAWDYEIVIYNGGATTGVSCWNRDAFDYIAEIELDDKFYSASALTAEQTFQLSTGYHKLYVRTTQVNVPYLFDGCSYFLDVKVSGNIINLPEYCFANCYQLDVVVLCEGVRTIGQYAFYGSSSIDVISIPDSMQVLQQYAFTHVNFIYMNGNQPQIFNAFDGWNTYMGTPTFYTISDDLEDDWYDLAEELGADCYYDQYQYYIAYIGNYDDGTDDFSYNFRNNSAYKFNLIYVDINQAMKELLGESPIWKDSYLTETNYTNEYYWYKYKINGSTIFEGKTVPINSKISVKINDIIKYQFDSQELVFPTDAIATSITNYLEVDVYASQDDWETTTNKGTYRFFYDWSYNDLTQYTTPIVGKVIDSRQYVIVSSNGFNNTETTMTLNCKDSNGNTKYNAQSTTNLGGRVIIKKMNSDIATCTVNQTTTYNVGKTHYKYCLYYRTLSGGWSWLLLNRTSKQTDTVTVNTYKQNWNNTTKEFGTNVFEKDIQRKWSVKSDYVGDKDSKTIHDAILTQKAYLHDLEEDTIVPVNITDTTVDVKTFYSNGRKQSQYSFTCEDAQTRMVL